MSMFVDDFRQMIALSSLVPGTSAADAYRFAIERMNHFYGMDVTLFLPHKGLDSPSSDLALNPADEDLRSSDSESFPHLPFIPLDHSYLTSFLTAERIARFFNRFDHSGMPDIQFSYALLASFGMISLSQSNPSEFYLTERGAQFSVIISSHTDKNGPFSFGSSPVLWSYQFVKAMKKAVPGRP